MLISAATTTSRDYFTLGSTKDEVLAVQGTPTSFSASEWNYGLSSIFFPSREGSVVGNGSGRSTPRKDAVFFVVGENV
jgi:hypothetical protein